MMIARSHDLEFDEFRTFLSNISYCRLEELRENTKICKDVGISGMDMRELIAAISDHFGTDFSRFPMDDIAGYEAFSVCLLIKHLFRRSESDVTVYQLFKAVRNGSWDDSILKIKN